MPWLIALVDLAVVQVSVVLGWKALLIVGPWLAIEPAMPVYQAVFSGVVILPFAYFLARLYPGYEMSPLERFRRRTCTNGAVFGVLAAWDFLARADTSALALLSASFVFITVLTPIVEAVCRKLLTRAGKWGTPVIVVGAGATGRKVSALLRSLPDYGMVPVGFLDDDAAVLETEIAGVPVLGPIASAADAATRARVAVLAMDDATNERLVGLSAALPFSRIYVVPNLVGLQSLCMESKDLAGMVALGVNRNLLLKHLRYIKTVHEFAFCALMLVLTLPLMGFIALAVMLESGTPVLFAQERLGHGHRRFRVLKFRTMRHDAESLEEIFARDPACRREYEVYHKLRQDPRVTPLGRFLRRSTLDELPQLFNVLRGDMSLVGPRPYMPEELADMDGADEVILDVPPGITGLWQISGRTAVSFKNRLEMDLYYIRNWTLWLDLYILLKTVAAVAIRRGAH